MPQVLIYFTFLLLEFLVLCYLLVRNFKDGIEPLYFAMAVAVLFALPLFKFGPDNDLVMRGSIPALAAVMFAVVDGWARPVRLLKPNVLVTLVLLIGAVTPTSEIARALLWPNWQPRLDRSVYDVTRGASPNYLAELRPGSLAAMVLRQPQSAIPVRRRPPRLRSGGAAPVEICSFSADLLSWIRRRRCRSTRSSHPQRCHGARSNDGCPARPRRPALRLLALRPAGPALCRAILRLPAGPGLWGTEVVIPHPMQCFQCGVLLLSRRSDWA